MERRARRSCEWRVDSRMNTQPTHGLRNFHFTQVCSGYGCFNRYLHRIDMAEVPAYCYCNLGRVIHLAHPVRKRYFRSITEIGEVGSDSAAK